MKRAYFLLRMFSLAGYMFIAYALLMPLTYSWTLDQRIVEAAAELYGDPALMVQGGETLTPAALLAAIIAGVLLGIGAGAYQYFRRSIGRPWLASVSCAACISSGIAAIYSARGEFGFGTSQRIGLASLLSVIAIGLCFATARALFGRRSDAPFRST